MEIRFIDLFYSNNNLICEVGIRPISLFFLYLSFFYANKNAHVTYLLSKHLDLLRFIYLD